MQKVRSIVVFATTALGLLDFNLVWVNPTYLMPGIVGGLIMGVGFIVGGFCERNSFYTGPQRPARRLKKVRPD